MGERLLVSFSLSKGRTSDWGWTLLISLMPPSGFQQLLFLIYQKHLQMKKRQQKLKNIFMVGHLKEPSFTSASAPSFPLLSLSEQLARKDVPVWGASLLSSGPYVPLRETSAGQQNSTSRCTAMSHEQKQQSQLWPWPSGKNPSLPVSLLF